MKIIRYGSLKTNPLGKIFFAVSDKGLCMVSMNLKTKDKFVSQVRESFPGYKIAIGKDDLSQYQNELREYFSGIRKKFELPLDLTGRTIFQQKVLKACAKIPFGEVISYGDLAKKAGSPKASRAVGNTMAINPIPIVIPCHRVIASGNKMGGFSGGIHKKEILHSLEKIDFSK